MPIITRLLASTRRHAAHASRGLLALPVLIVSCQPACEPAVAPVPEVPAAPRVIEERQIGTSVEGRPIIAYRLGTPGGIVVLAVGSIHGDEQAGIEIVEHVRDTAAIPDGLDVWVIPTINPDGNLTNSETNAAGVDLNRNFGPNWELIDCVADPQNCSGPEPMSEPESKALAEFVPRPSRGSPSGTTPSAASSTTRCSTASPTLRCSRRTPARPATASPPCRAG